MTRQGSKEKGRSAVTKFKIRCSKYLYTLVIKDEDKAKKLMQSLPPGLQRFDLCVFACRRRRPRRSAGSTACAAARL